MSEQNNAQDKDNAYTQAVAQANSIAAMVAALNVDYDRLEELNQEHDDLTLALADAEEAGDEQAITDAKIAIEQWDSAEEWNELKEAANGNDSEDEAREAIQQDALDVQVRSDWHSPGDTDSGKPNEFMILLCTGCLAVRIMGELDEHLQPCNAWIEYQDWFWSWQEAVSVIEQHTLLTYCQQFWFGE